jgi:hypothetical protein
VDGPDGSGSMSRLTTHLTAAVVKASGKGVNRRPGQGFEIVKMMFPKALKGTSKEYSVCPRCFISAQSPVARGDVHTSSGQTHTADL